MIFNLNVLVEAETKEEAYELFTSALTRQFETHDLWDKLAGDNFGIVRINEVYSPQEDVTKFMETAGQQLPEYPQIMDEAVHTLRYNLIREELEEYKHETEQKNIVGIADAIGDLLYVVYGSAVAHGIDIYPIFQEIHKSNMTKFIDGYRRESDGKWMKGPSYTPVNLEPLIQAQIDNHEKSKALVSNSEVLFEPFDIKNISVIPRKDQLGLDKDGD